MNMFTRILLAPCLIAAALALATAEAPAQPPAAPAMPAQSAGPDIDAIRESLGTTLPEDAIIQYDAETDSIIIITDEETNAQIGRVIEAIDRPVPQVLIKVLFLEVTHTDDLDLGVEGSYSYGSADFPDSIATDFGLSDATQGGFYNIVTDDLRVTMRALATQGKLEVLSRPSVLARNNELAIITIGSEVPFVRNVQISEEGRITNTIEYEDIGIILQVVPHITNEGMVEMEVLPEISTLTAETVPITGDLNAPVIAKRSAETRVVVADGKTVVIGGLMEDNDVESIRKIPILGDIPVVGWLFRRKITEKTKTELLIFLTPYVISGETALDAMTARERSQTEIMPQVLNDTRREKFLDEKR